MNKLFPQLVPGKREKSPEKLKLSFSGVCITLCVLLTFCDGSLHEKRRAENIP